MTGGRWKPAHHWLQQHLFNSHIIACGVNASSPASHSSSLLCFVKNDIHLPAAGHVTVTAVDLAGGPPSVLYSQRVELAAGPGSVLFWTLPSPANRTGVVLRAEYASTGERPAVLASNVAYLAAPFELQLPAVALTAAVAEQTNADGSYNVTVSKAGKGAALFVTLTTRAEGRFSHNCFLMEGPSEVVTFQPWAEDQSTTLAQSLRLEHAAMYQNEKTVQAISVADS